jgi:PAS domain S-box-containing protein
MSTRELFEALETLLDARPEASGGEITADSQELIRELRIHQLELEIQNRELRGVQEQLAHSRVRYADLFDFSPIGYASFDEKVCIQEINLTGARLLGETPHRLIGRCFSDFVVAADAARFISHLQRCRHTRRKRSIELQLKTYDVSALDVELFTLATQDLDRHTFQFRTAILDISARKQAEEEAHRTHIELEERVASRTAELTQSHNLLRTVIDKARDVIYVKDLAGRYLMINAEGAQIVGRPAEEIVGKRDAELFSPKIGEELMRKHRQVVDSQESLTFEFLLETGNGKRWFQTTAGPYHDHTGRVIGVVGIARDITERRKREDAERFLGDAGSILSASLDYATTLSSLARIAIPHLADSCVVDMVQEDRSIRRVAAAHVQAGQEPALWRMPPFTNVIETGKSEIHAEKGDPLLGDLGLQSLISVPMLIRGRSIGAITFMESRPERRPYGISDLTLAEDLADRAAIAVDNASLYWKEQEANRLKDEFLSTISHELRTPLTPILGGIFKLRTTRPNDQNLIATLDILERNARRQARIIEDLLDISRIASNNLELHRRPTNLAALVDGAVQVIRPAAEALGIHLDTHLESFSRPVWCDRERIRQVLWNILSNAIKFTPQGGRIDVTLESSSRFARITIEDTGIGIIPDFLPHVFERFRQADSFTTRLRGGLGLGLSIVRYIVERHGGSVRAESEGEGKGARFILDLPYS